jgi:hypothetical protein
MRSCGERRPAGTKISRRLRETDAEGRLVRQQIYGADQLRCHVSDAEYRARSQQHAPKTAEEILEAAKSLAAAGFSDYTVAAILQADVNAVRQLIGERN